MVNYEYYSEKLKINDLLIDLISWKFWCLWMYAKSKLLKKENKNICTISRNLIFINIKYIYMCTSTFSTIRLSFIDQYFIFSIAIKLHENGLDFYRNFQAAWWSERILGSKTRYVGFWFLLDIRYPRSTFYWNLWCGIARHAAQSKVP